MYGIQMETFEVDYDSLVSSYTDNLENVLRGFKPEPDFLELWVHDEDDVRSIFNIAEAAEGNIVGILTMVLSKEVLARIDVDTLLGMLNQVCETELVSTDDGAKVVLKYE
jgi:hypothetical protein